MMNPTATYSPEDNKLRLYPVTRLDSETYNRVKEAGFKWAPKQELFVAPMWTPARENLLIDLCGEIGDEDKSLVERAEERGERFEEYSDKRKADYEQAHKTVKQIADCIPFGQPILVGHHSERRARKDAERIENGMRKAVQMWETSEYWKQRAAGALRAAKYKERPDVRARRIKKIEADKRKQERYKADAEKWLAAWSKEELTHEEAVMVAGFCRLLMPRKDGDKPDFNQNPTAYDALSNSYPSLYAPRSVAEVVAVAKRVYPATIAHCERWINHFENRLAYEKAMLDEQGGTVADKTGPEKGGACRCWASPRGGWSYIQKVNKVSVTVLDNWGNGGRNFTRTMPFDKLLKIMTAAEVEEKRVAGLLVENEEKTGFFLRELPSDEAKEKATTESATAAPAEVEKKKEGEEVQAMREQIKTGVQVVAAPQLFPTPSELAARMVALAKIEPGNRVLEPSAGLGGLLGAMGCRMFGHYPESGAVVAVEVNSGLASVVRREYPKTDVRCADFLECNGDLGTFDRVVMNPPFEKAADIKHIRHAYQMLRPGGRLVALCANGPRQREAFKDEAAFWEDLPAGSFKEQGTGVNVALLVLEKKQLSLF